MDKETAVSSEPVKVSVEIKESVAEGTMAYAIVEYMFVDDPKLYASVLVMLNITGKSWKIISDTRSFTVCASGEARLLGTKTTSKDIASICEGADWYCNANRTLDGALMSKVFTETASLTFTNPEGQLVSISQPDFCNMVTNRWNSPKHSKWAHLKADPRIAQADALLSVAIALPRLAVVKLRVTFPPVCLYDFLTYAKFPADDKSGPVWRIVAKSTINEPFLVDEQQEK